VDTLLVTPKGFFLVEIKSSPGVLAGDGRTKAIDNPAFLANLKAKKLASPVQRQRVFGNLQTTTKQVTSSMVSSYEALSSYAARTWASVELLLSVAMN
jgi:hypothetical protein